MKTFKYGYAAAFEAAKRKKEDDILTLFSLLFLILTFVVALFRAGLWVSKPKPTPVSPAVIIEGARGLIDKKDKGNTVLWSAWANSAYTAVGLWTNAGVDPGGRRLIADPSACDPTAVACADRSIRTIYVAKQGEDVDRTTIMMHEIGHILGVPHIEGDPLMDARYQGKPLAKPSAAAVAMAKLSNSQVIFYGTEVKP